MSRIRVGERLYPFAEHPQSASTGKPIAVTADPQICGARGCGWSCWMMSMLIRISPQPSIELVGDSDNTALKSFEVRVKCRYCGDHFQLCPLRGGLEHTFCHQRSGTKIAKAVCDAATDIGRNSSLCSGKHGRPSSSSGATEVNQHQLHYWYGAGSMSGEQTSHHRMNLTMLGFWKTCCSYAWRSYDVLGLVHDPNLS